MAKVVDQKRFAMSRWSDGSHRSYPEPETPAATGLDFPGSPPGDGGGTYRFQFNTPFAAFPATYIWRCYPRQQASYYTTLFWGNGEVAGFDNQLTYYGFHPYPQPTSSSDTHYWEIAADGGSDVTDEQDVVYDTWYTQVARVYLDGSGHAVYEYYWNWPSLTDVVTHTSSVVYDDADDPASPAIMVGDATWNEGDEVYDGILRGFQFYNSQLSLADVQDEIDSPGSVITPWYLKLNPTPADIADESGNGNDPVWIGSNRPTLWESE